MLQVVAIDDLAHSNRVKRRSGRIANASMLSNLRLAPRRAAAALFTTAVGWIAFAVALMRHYLRCIDIDGSVIPPQRPPAGMRSGAPAPPLNHNLRPPPPPAVRPESRNNGWRRWPSGEPDEEAVLPWRHRRGRRRAQGAARQDERGAHHSKAFHQPLPSRVSYTDGHQD